MYLFPPFDWGEIALMLFVEPTMTVRVNVASRSSCPAECHGALFSADYSRDCIWTMPEGADGRS